jgi:siroheme synthase-like protein
VPLDTPGFPVSLLLAGRPCLVVGGEDFALQKARTLLAAGATVTLVSEQFAPGAESLGARLERRAYEPGEVAGYHLVISATMRPEIDGAVFADAERHGVLCNAADDPSHCSFVLPAIHRVGPLSIAVSTDGHSPAVASYLRDEIATAFGEWAGALTSKIGTVRSRLRRDGLPTMGRDWRGLIAEVRSAEDPDAVAERWLKQEIGRPTPDETSPPKG